MADPAWAVAVARARAARIVLALGASDTGKTSLVTLLARALLDAGRSVAVVDADLGQSEIGPPTTIGLGRLHRPFARLGDAELVGLHFVGATSPQAHIRSTVAGTRLLTERALRLGVDHVLVDTSGLVHGEVGRRLKLEKIDAVDPELVVCLERDGECGHILERYAGVVRPAILRLPAVPAARPRSAEERRRRRERALAAYFAGAQAVTLDLDRLRGPEPSSGRGRAAAHAAPGETAFGCSDAPAHDGPFPDLSGDDLRDMLVGLDDAAGETLGLGIVRACDRGTGTLVVETPVPGPAIDRVRLGRRPVAAPDCLRLDRRPPVPRARGAPRGPAPVTPSPGAAPG